MEKLEVMVQGLMWEKRGDGGRIRRKKKGNAFFFLCDSFSVSLFFLPLKSETQSAEGQ